MKILHTADWHIKDKEIQEVTKCLDFIVRTALEEEPDLIVHSGDALDSNGTKMDSESARLLFKTISELGDIAPLIMVAGTKSHEGQATTILKYVKSKHPIYVSSHPEQIYLCEGMFARTAADIEAFGRVDAVLSILPTPTKQFFVTEANISDSDKEIANALSALFAGFGVSAHEFGDASHILVGHFAVGGAYLSETQILIGREIEVSPDQIGLANADLVCLGHIHENQLMKPNIYYSGSIYRKDIGEQSPRGFYIHELGQDAEEYGLSVPGGVIPIRESRFIETPARKLLRNINDFTDGPIELDAALYALEPEEIKDSLVRVEFTTWQDEAEQLDREKIKQFYMDAGAQDVDVRIIRKPRENIRSEKLLKLTTLRDKIKERAALNGEEVSESILLKADELEAMEPDEIVRGVAGL